MMIGRNIKLEEVNIIKNNIIYRSGKERLKDPTASQDLQPFPIDENLKFEGRISEGEVIVVPSYFDVFVLEKIFNQIFVCLFEIGDHEFQHFLILFFFWN